MTEQHDPKDFWYGPGGDRDGDRAGMRCIASMTADEARQALCNMIYFGIWHSANQFGYEHQQALREAAFEQIFETTQ